MPRKAHHTLALFLIGLFAGCHTAYGEGKQLFSVKGEDKIARSIKRYSARRLASYDFSPDLTVAQRINRQGEHVLTYIQDYDGRKDYRLYHPTARERNHIIRVWQQLPPVYHKILRQRLVGIYFIDNFWGNGFTEWVVDKQNKIYSFIAFNKRVLKDSAQKLINTREKTCFHPPTDKKSNIDVNIRLHPNESGFLYILTHEATHVIDYAHNITPFTDPSYNKYLNIPTRQSHNFWRQSWRSYFIPQDKTRLYRHKKISFYGFKKGPHLELKEALPLYRSLQKSDFVSLYSALSWAEDLAELATFYILTQKHGLQYEIQVWQDNQLLFAYEPWHNEQMRQRMKLAFRQIQEATK